MDEPRGPGLAARLGIAGGPLAATIRQGETLGRPSTLELEAEVRDCRVTDVRLGGSAVLIGEGPLRPPD